VGDDLMALAIVRRCRDMIAGLAEVPLEARISAINDLRQALHAISPFKNEPVDCVVWVPLAAVHANDYNPNTVAPPEMRLLAHSIETDGYTQPIVTCRENEKHEIVDGFHRSRAAREIPSIRERVKSYLPVTEIKPDRTGKADRVAATIRHNRARGKHGVEAMSKIVVDLARRNWSDQKIAKELGMEPDEVLRLKQITGLAEMFCDREFSEAWDVE
jgi:ParB-like chromosome segregation protein Spo0J